MRASRRLLRTIRLDASDTIVFERAAEPGDWAVPGTFLFWGRTPQSLSRKERVAFRSAFLGVESWGFSTLAIIQPATEEERQEAVRLLAEQLVRYLGAPNFATALPAAEQEIAEAESLCRGHADNTLIALHREFVDGAIRERFRTLRPRAETAYAAPYLAGHDRAFHVVDVEEDEAAPDFDLRRLTEKE